MIFDVCFFPANIVFHRCFFREHEKEVQNRKRGKRPRGRPRKHVVSPGGGGNPWPRRCWRGSGLGRHQRVSVQSAGCGGCSASGGW